MRSSNELDCRLERLVASLRGETVGAKAYCTSTRGERNPALRTPSTYPAKWRCTDVYKQGLRGKPQERAGHGKTYLKKRTRNSLEQLRTHSRRRVHVSALTLSMKLKVFLKKLKGDFRLPAGETLPPPAPPFAAAAGPPVRGSSGSSPASSP